MTNAGWATLGIIPSMQGFQGRLTAGVAGPMAAAGKSGGAKFGQAAGVEAGARFRSGWAEKMKGFAPFAGIAVGALAVDFFSDAISGASDLAESGNKMQAIFGDAQNEVAKFASTASDALGQTELQARDAASTFGTFGKAAGLTGGALASFSTDLTGLATDLASFYNTDVSTAIESIGAALRGESEPIRQYGILLDDATLRAQALKLGLVETTKEALSPANKVLAANAEIMRQSADAQGDFAKTSDGLANQQRILNARWQEMKTTVGGELLPVVTGFVTFLADDAIPALSAAGGMAKDAGEAIGSLPTPVKAAAGAFLALRVASAAGITSATLSGYRGAAGALESMRLRAMLAGDAFRTSRAGVMEFNGNVGRIVAPVGRARAALDGLAAGAAGVGGSFRRGISGAVSMLGGPWGIALAGATAAAVHFWQENQEARARVEALTDSLDKQTGALTKNTRELAFKTLQESGALGAARDLGLNLSIVTDAALGNADALRIVTGTLADLRAEQDAALSGNGRARGFEILSNADIQNIGKVRDAISGQNAELTEARQSQRDYSEVMRDSGEASETAARQTRTYADRVAAARDAVMSLFNAENKRRLAAVQSKRDELALIETMRAAEREAREGKKTLDENTKAGRANWNALLDLADQWNQSKGSVTNARGAYERMREQFIKVAEEMGATDGKAKRLADRFLKIPKNVRTKFTTDGMDAALEKLRAAKTLIQSFDGSAVRINGTYGGRYTARATGGPVMGGSTYLVGERGPEIFTTRNSGTIVPNHQISRTTNNTQSVNIERLVVQDWRDTQRQLQELERRQAGGGVSF